ncbi:MAG: tRNA (adenosine(37)-N6)-threonylcarbamoyltransferase complex transferase subunit TsaD [Vulcanibacillus sp.]
MITNWERDMKIEFKKISEENIQAPIYILAIESSCDETAVAIVEDGTKILANVISSQIEIHKRFGGVVPEVASRKHVEVINILLEQALKDAGLKLNEISAIAVTYGPGLIGSLLVGLAAAKTLSFVLKIPLIGVHHISGHIYANHLVTPLKFPLIALVVSGGHTEIIYMDNHLNFEILGQTRDDAAGEAFDKVARILNLPYPGGPHIDKLAQKGEPKIPLPRARLDNKYDFSFSGLKSAVINAVHNAEQKNEQISKEDMAASFQEAVIDVLVNKTISAVKEKKVDHLIIAGGVAANSELRGSLENKCKELKINLTIPPIELCTDNAAMVASVGYYQYISGNWSKLDLNGTAGLPINNLINDTFL